MPAFWNRQKKKKKLEYRAQAQSFLRKTDVVIRGTIRVNEKATGPPFRHSTPSPPPSPLLPPPSPTTYPWSIQPLQFPHNDADISPIPRYGHTVAAFPPTHANYGDTYLFGGLVLPDSLTSDLYLITSSVDTISAKLIPTSGDVPSGRVGHAMALMDDLLIVWGGDTNADPTGNHDDDLYVMHTETNTWTRISTPNPRPKARYGHTAIVIGSRFLIFGGQADETFFNDMWSIDIASPHNPSAWVQIEPFGGVAPSPRTGHVAIESQGQLYIFGGTDGLYHYNDTWSFDWKAQLWSELRCTGLIPAPREGHAAAVVSDVIYIFGGRGTSGTHLEDLAAFTISDQQWFGFQNMGPDAPSRRSGHKMVAAGAKIYMLGGDAFATGTMDPDLVHVLDTGA